MRPRRIWRLSSVPARRPSPSLHSRTASSPPSREAPSAAAAAPWLGLPYVTDQAERHGNGRGEGKPTERPSCQGYRREERVTQRTSYACCRASAACAALARASWSCWVRVTLSPALGLPKQQPIVPGWLVRLVWLPGKRRQTAQDVTASQLPRLDTAAPGEEGKLLYKTRMKQAKIALRNNNDSLCFPGVQSVSRDRGKKVPCRRCRFAISQP